MNKFDDDLYNFIIKPENFEPVFELSNRFNDFKERLIINFWRKVVSYLEFNEPELKGWKYCIQEEVPQSGSMIYLYKDEYCSKITQEPASVLTTFYNEVSGGGKIILGVSFDRTLSKLNYEKVRKFAAQIIKAGWKLSPPNIWTFPIYKYMDEDFNSYDSLRKILPSEEDYLAKEYADTLMSTHIELYPLIEKFGIKF